MVVLSTKEFFYFQIFHAMPYFERIMKMLTTQFFRFGICHSKAASQYAVICPTIVLFCHRFQVVKIMFRSFDYTYSEMFCFYFEHGLPTSTFIWYSKTTYYENVIFSYKCKYLLFSDLRRDIKSTF